ncbi:MAG: hypothetical protein AB7U29_17690 [Desulfobulbus sp.]
MSFTITWQAAAILVTLLLAWSGFLVGIVKWLLVRAITNIEERVNTASTTATSAVTGLQQHREEYLAFLGRLPIDYYRREDMIRFETLTHAKLDALATDIRQLECRKCQHKPQ